MPEKKFEVRKHLDSKRFVSVSADAYGLYVTVCTNGYQSNSISVDDKMLDALKAVIVEYKERRRCSDFYL